LAFGLENVAPDVLPGARSPCNTRHLRPKLAAEITSGNICYRRQTAYPGDPRRADSRPFPRPRADSVNIVAEETWKQARLGPHVIRKDGRAAKLEDAKVELYHNWQQWLAWAELRASRQSAARSQSKSLLGILGRCRRMQTPCKWNLADDRPS
jgi:hypothetical protein